MSPFSTFVFNFADHLSFDRVILEPAYNQLPSKPLLTLAYDFF